MPLSHDDRCAITDLINLHGHLCDSGELDRFGEVFTDDVVYDVSDMGGGELHGVEALAAAGLALGEGNPVGHHVTNIILEERADGLVHARSKGLGVRADGTTGSLTYEDTVVRGERGWRIGRRKLIVHRVPLNGVWRTP